MRRKLVVLVAALLSGIVLGVFLMVSARTPTKNVVAAFSSGGPATVYQWRDKNGMLQWSNVRPPAGIDYQVVTADGAALSRMDPPPPPTETESPAAASINPLSVYTPGGAQQMLENAQSAIQATNQREEEMRRKIEGLQ